MIGKPKQVKELFTKATFTHWVIFGAIYWVIFGAIWVSGFIAGAIAASKGAFS